MKLYDDYVWPDYRDLAHELMPVRDKEPDWTEDSFGRKAIGIKWSDGGFIEPLLLDEIHRMPEKDSLAFQRERLDVMARRMERFTSYMVWEALRGKVVVNYSGASHPLQIPYPIVEELRRTLAIPWTVDQNADPMADIDSLLDHPIIREEFGPEPRVVMNSRTADKGMKCKRAMTVEYMTGRLVEICDQGFRTEEQNGAESQQIRYLRDGEVWVFPKKEKPGYVANMAVSIADDEEEDQFWEGMGPLVGEFAMKGPDGEALGQFMRVSSMRIPVIDRSHLVAKITAYIPENEPEEDQ